MATGCILKRDTRGVLLPFTSTGEHIQNIAPGGIKFFQSERDRKSGIVRVQLEILVWEKDIEGGYPLSERIDPSDSSGNV
jgi:hypothetical protein